MNGPFDPACLPPTSGISQRALLLTDVEEGDRAANAEFRPFFETPGPIFLDAGHTPMGSIDDGYDSP